MKRKTSGPKKISWQEYAFAHWPGLLAVAAYLAAFALFPFWRWLILAPLVPVLFRLLKADDWPALLTALLYVLCFPHARLGFLGFICLTPVVLSVWGDDPRRAWRLGWLAGTFGNLGKLYWLVHTISYFSPIPFPVAVLILLLLCTTLGLFWAIHFRATHWLVNRYRLPLWFVLPAGWVFWDYWLTYFLGGFPWEVLGGAAFHIPLLNQTFDLLGEFALCWLLAFGNVVAAQWVRFARKQAAFPVAATAVLGAATVAGLIYGALRTDQIDALMRQGKEIKVGLLQANVDQNRKWSGGFREQIIDDYANLAVSAADNGADLIVMPETSIPMIQPRWMPLDVDVTRYPLAAKRYVLAGVPTEVKRLDRTDPRGLEARYNSAVLLAPEGEDLAWYDKNRLVPFGEYIPKKHWLQKIAGKALKGTFNFEESGRYTLMPYPPAQFAVFICYESIYPSTVRRLNRLGAKFLVTITNDAWFGNTSSPQQHWAQVAMRAIENRRWIARAANTGISGIIDPLGRTVVATPLEVKTMVVGSVHTMDVHTVYETVGDVAAWLGSALYLAAVGYGLARRRKEKKSA